MATVIQLFRRFLACTNGATGTEYAICTALLIVVAIVAISALGGISGGVRELSSSFPQHSGGSLDGSPLLVQRTE